MKQKNKKFFGGRWLSRRARPGGGGRRTKRKQKAR
jgi:hypothetical protein